VPWPDSTLRRGDHNTQSHDKCVLRVSLKTRFVVACSVNVLLFPVIGDRGLKFHHILLSLCVRRSAHWSRNEATNPRLAKLLNELMVIKVDACKREARCCEPTQTSRRVWASKWLCHFYRQTFIGWLSNFTMTPSMQQSSFSSVVIATACFVPKIFFRWYNVIWTLFYWLASCCVYTLRVLDCRLRNEFFIISILFPFAT
jgi:hypothetical protein